MIKPLYSISIFKKYATCIFVIFGLVYKFRNQKWSNKKSFNKVMTIEKKFNKNKTEKIDENGKIET